MRVRRDVQSLIAEGDSGMAVLEAYADGIRSMQELDPGDSPPEKPRSWRFQAAIHGFPGLDATVDHPLHWASCRHNSWFFLPWHRLYLFCFERIVQSHLGDDDWSLPYWDYSKASASSRVIPAPFRAPGTPLHTPERDPRRNHPTAPLPIDREDANPMGALAIETFALEVDDTATSFGGDIVADVLPMSRARGALELTPHGLVHGAVGGEDPPGLMSLFETAGLDPIFWLHHANIDRLWDVWIQEWGADALPDDQTWLDTEFEFFDGDESRLKRRIGDLLDSEALGYRYESTDPPRPIPRRPGPMGIPFALMMEARPEMAKPELVGASDDVSFATRADVGIELDRPRHEVFAAVAITEPTRWFLRVEDVVGREPGAPRYDVYLNLPEGHKPSDHPELRAGSIASFGMAEASKPGGEGGLGVTDVFDVTELLATLRDSFGWDGGDLNVTVVPGGAEHGGDVRAGRIGLYAG